MFSYDARKQFEERARLSQEMNRQRMSSIVKDDLGQQFNLGNPKEDSEVFKLNDEQTKGPAIQIKIKGMLNDAMTKPLAKRGNPSINIEIS